MKIYQSIVLALLSVFMITSCSDYFDQVPDDRLSIKEIFKTRNGAREHLAGVYTYMPDEFNQRQVQETHLFRTQGPWTGASDEIEYTLPDYKGRMINNNTINATEGTMVKMRWRSWYTGIHEAAVFLENIDQTPDDQVTAREKQQWKAEARAVRAIYYFYLVRTYGPVPVLEENYALDTPTQDLQLPRNTVDECFDFIVSELKYAQQNGLLDNAITDDKDTGAGRIDKAIAQAFIIEALTFRASWLFNGECRYYANLANPDGTKLFPAAPTQAEIKENWQKVVTECNAFFTNYGSRFQLEYADRNGDPIQSPQDAAFDPYQSYRRGVKCRYVDLLTHKEAIFYIYQNSAGTLQYDRMPNDSRISGTDYKGGSLQGATQEMVDAYFMANGKSPILGYRADGVTPIINEESGYVESGTISTPYVSPTGQVYAPNGTYNMYVNREPRFYADITFNGQKWFGPNGDDGNYTDFTYSGPNGKQQGVNDYTTTGYLVRKLMNGGHRDTHDQVCILLRLANVYFNYIEALCHVDPTHNDIFKYLNLMRERAGIPLYGEGPNALPRPTGAANIMEAIRKEKRVELSFENCRYFDVRRWGLVNEYFNKPVHGMNVNGDGDDFYKRTQVVERTFERQYFFPIPQGEIDIDKNLVQNTGY